MKTIITTLFLFISFVSFSQDSIIKYYNEIAGRSEYGDSNATFCKWKTNVKVYFDFENSDSIKKYSEEVIKDLNDTKKVKQIYWCILVIFQIIKKYIMLLWKVNLMDLLVQTHTIILYIVVMFSLVKNSEGID